MTGLSEEEVRTAMASPEHLVRWLNATGRKFLVFDASDMVRALPWPDGVDYLIQIIAAYRDYRRTKETGYLRLERDETGTEVKVAMMKSDALTFDELVNCIEWMQVKASEAASELEAIKAIDTNR